MKPMRNETRMTDHAIRTAPLPTPATLRRRSSPGRQLVRFAALNARIMRMVIKGHASSPHPDGCPAAQRQGRPRDRGGTPSPR